MKPNPFSIDKTNNRKDFIQLPTYLFSFANDNTETYRSNIIPSLN